MRAELDPITARLRKDKPETPPLVDAGANFAVTGLQPNGEHALAKKGGKVELTRGKGARADGGGVLWQPLP